MISIGSLRERRWAGPILAGIVLASTVVGTLTPVPAAEALAASIVALSIWVLVPPCRVRFVLVVVAVATASAANGASARDRTLQPPLARWVPASQSGARATRPVVLSGVLRRDAVRSGDGVRLLIDVHRVHDGQGWHDVRGRVSAFVGGELFAGHVPDWTAGRPIAAPATLREPQVWSNPGAPSIAWQRLTRHFDLLATIKSASLVSVERGRWWHEGAAAVRAFVRRSVTQALPQPERAQSASIVTAILIGDRAGLDDELAERLQAAGTYHVIAISGGNIAILSGFVLLAVRLVIRRRVPSLTIALAVVAGYGWIVGGEPSVARATLVACLYFAAALAGFSSSPLHVLAVAALGLTAFDPLIVLDAGAWLSFMATFAIIVAARRLATWMNNSGRVPLSIAARARTALLAMFAATTAAELALLPINASVFSRVSVAGLLLNFIAIPAMTAVQIAGMLCVMLTPLSSFAAGPAVSVAHASARALIDSSTLVTWAPWLSWRTPAPPIAMVVLFYAAMLWLLVEPRARLRRAAALLVLTGAIAIVTGPFAAYGAPRAGVLRVTALDVGQGDAVLVQFPSGRSLLVDAGPSRGAFDAGERVVTPAFWALGGRRLDWLLVTHPDLDHIGGAVAAARALAPVEIWEGVPVPRDVERARLRDNAASGRVAWRRLQRGDALDAGGVALDVLHPPVAEWERQRTRNDDSVVLRLRYGDAEFLLTGDVGGAVEDELKSVVSADPQRLRVLKIAHHGSRSSSSAGFVSAYIPTVAVVSAGRDNLFGHPAPDVLARLRETGTRLFRTDRDGAVVMETDGKTVSVRTMSGVAWNVAVWP